MWSVRDSIPFISFWSQGKLLQISLSFNTNYEYTICMCFIYSFLLCFLLNAETKHSMWKNIFTKSDADLCPFASQGRKWENILFYHSSHLCAHVTFNLLLTRQIFSRPLTQENLGKYPFHSPSLCLQQKSHYSFSLTFFAQQ